MGSFKTRSTEKELLDADYIQTADLERNLYELDRINHLLGGHSATLQGLERLVKKYPQKEYQIIDLGCGGGDTLRVIANWAEKRKLKVQLTGVDILPDAVAYAKKQSSNVENIHFEVRDIRNLNSGEYDIAISSLFTHHLYGDDLNQLLQTKKRISRLGFINNDLHRHALAYYSIKWLTRVLSKSHLVKNDAPLSVARGFKKHEWNEILAIAGIKNYTIEWIWAFRHLIIGYHGKN